MGLHLKAKPFALEGQRWLSSAHLLTGMQSTEPSAHSSQDSRECSRWLHRHAGASCWLARDSKGRFLATVLLPLHQMGWRSWDRPGSLTALQVRSWDRESCLFIHFKKQPPVQPDLSLDKDFTYLPNYFSLSVLGSYVCTCAPISQVPFDFVCVSGLGIKPRAFYILSKYSSTQLCPWLLWPHLQSAD